VRRQQKACCSKLSLFAIFIPMSSIIWIKLYYVGIVIDFIFEYPHLHMFCCSFLSRFLWYPFLCLLQFTVKSFLAIASLIIFYVLRNKCSTLCYILSNLEISHSMLIFIILYITFRVLLFWDEKCVVVII